jgi:dipeptidyl aminopeptidase/acylaminoacyl peptidase
MVIVPGAAGYVVLEPNFRGSTGYGEHFRNLNVEDSGGGEIEDIGAAVSYLVNAGLADPKRVAIAVTKLPGTFAAGIECLELSTERSSFSTPTATPGFRWETKMGGIPAEKPAVYQKADVLPEVDKVKTPLLILHGEQDPQVPPQESAEFAAALKNRGRYMSILRIRRKGTDSRGATIDWTPIKEKLRSWTSISNSPRSPDFGGV